MHVSPLGRGAWLARPAAPVPATNALARIELEPHSKRLTAASLPVLDAVAPR